MGVDSVRCACVEGDEVASLLDLQEAVGLRRLDDPHLRDAVAVVPIQNVDIEDVALSDPVEIGEELRPGKSRVAGDPRVGRRASDRQGRAVEVAGLFLQGLI